MVQPKKKPNWVLIVLAIAATFGCLCVVLPMLSMFWGMTVPPTPESVIAKVDEKTAKPSELGATGTILRTEGRGVVALDVATGQEKTVYELDDRESIHSLAGPNDNGIAIAIVNLMTDKRHRLVRLDLNTGKHRVIFDRPGDALWGNAIGENSAIARNADVALILRGTGNHQFQNPPAYMTEGELQRVDLTTDDVRVINPKAIDSEMSLSYDGRTAWYVAETDAKVARGLIGGTALDPAATSVPAVVAQDDSGTKPIAFGWGAFLMQDGQTMILRSNGGPDQVVDVKTGEIKPNPLADDYMYDLRAITDNGLSIAKAQHVRVEDVEFTKNNGMPGPRPMNRIVAYDPKSKRVATLVKAIDPRTEWSYGEWTRTGKPKSPRATSEAKDLSRTQGQAVPTER